MTQYPWYSNRGKNRLRLHQFQDIFSSMRMVVENKCRRVVVENKAQELAAQLRSVLDAIPKVLCFKVKRLKKPSKSPLFRLRALWLLEVYPRVAMWLLRSMKLREELEHVANLGESLLLHLKRLGCPPKASEKQVRLSLAPKSEPREIGLSEEDRKAFLKALDDLAA